jgi:elongation factor 3
VCWGVHARLRREALNKVDRKISDEEKAKMAQAFVVDGVKRVVERILGRRKLKSSYEYEVQWVNCGPDKNTFLPRDQLIDMGFEKMVVEVDAKEAAMAGLMAKPLTALNIQKHLEDFGLEPEFSTHSLMRGLSGGQKVKVSGVDTLLGVLWQAG